MTTWKHFLLIAFVVLAAKTNSTVGSTHDEGIIAHPGSYYAEAAEGDFRNFCEYYYIPLAWQNDEMISKDRACNSVDYSPDDTLNQNTIVNPCAWYSPLEYSDDENAYFAADQGRCLPSAKASCNEIQNNVVEIEGMMSDDGSSEIRWFEIENAVTFIPEHFKFGVCPSFAGEDRFEYGIKFQGGNKPLFLEENSLTYLIENIGVEIKYIMKSSRVPNIVDSDDPNGDYTSTFISLLDSQGESIEVVDEQDVLQDDMDGQGSADIMGDDACVQDPSLCKMDRKAVLPWWSFALGFVAIPLVFSFALGAALRKK